MHRREFLRDLGAGCGWLLAVPLIIGTGSCSMMPVIAVAELDGHNMLRVPVADLGDGDRAIIRSAQLRDDLLLRRNMRGAWCALPLRCTHRDQPLSVHATGVSCSAHGSSFDLDGHVTAGPATTDLLMLNVVAGPQILLVDIQPLL